MDNETVAATATATLAPNITTIAPGIGPVTISLDADGADWNFLGLIANGLFFVGISFLLWGGDHSQTSLRTVSLLAISSLLAFPLGGSVAQWVFYFLFVAVWAYVLYAIYGCGKQQGDNNSEPAEGEDAAATTSRRAEGKRIVGSALKKTYDNNLDSFPHWILCLCPSVGAFFCIYFFLEYSGDTGINKFEYCRDNYADHSKDCTDVYLQLMSICIRVLSYIPQGYLILKVWAGHSEKSTAGALHFRVKVFMACMFACYVLRTFSWIWWAQKAREDTQEDLQKGEDDEFQFSSIDLNSIYNSAYFLVFFCGNVFIVITIAFPWIYRITCFRCGCCTLVKPNKSSAQGDGDLAMQPNTGQSNDAAAAITDAHDISGENQTNSGPSIWSSWTPFGGKKEDSNTNNASNNHNQDVTNVEEPAIMGINTTYYPETFSNGDRGGNTNSNTNTSNNPYYSSAPPAQSSADETPDWLRDN